MICGFVAFFVSETGKLKTEILFQCDYAADEGKPTLIQVYLVDSSLVQMYTL